MLPISVRALLTRLERGNAGVLTPAVATDETVSRLIGRPAGRGAAPVTDKQLADLLGRDEVAWDAKTKQFIATESHEKIDLTVHPNDKSAIFDGSIEQCMEFVMRYFRTVRAKFGLPDGGFGSDWTKQYNIAEDVKGIANGTLKEPGYTAYRNGDSVPPRAGDVLSMQSPTDGTAPPRHFHVALISDVYKKGRDWMVRVYEANVPYHVNNPDPLKHFEEIPLRVRNGKFTLDRVHTRANGYTTDMDVVGWIHPLDAKALPGTVSPGK